MRNLNIVPAAILVLLGAVACGEAPREEIAAAQAAVEEAKNAEAGTWAPDELQAAEEAMKAADAEIAAQDQKWMKSYDKAAELLARAQEEAARAAEAAAANKEQTRQDAEVAIADADTALQAAEAALQVAPVSKDSKADLELYKGDVATLRTSLQEARDAQAAGDYKQALETASSIKEKSTTIATQLTEARNKQAAARR